MSRFVGATMWVMKYVFGLDDKYLLCKLDEKEDCFLSNGIMYTGKMDMVKLASNGVGDDTQAIRC